MCCCHFVTCHAAAAGVPFTYWLHVSGKVMGVKGSQEVLVMAGGPGSRGAQSRAEEESAKQPWALDVQAAAHA